MRLRVIEKVPIIGLPNTQPVAVAPAIQVDVRRTHGAKGLSR